MFEEQIYEQLYKLTNSLDDVARSIERLDAFGARAAMSPDEVLRSIAAAGPSAWRWSTSANAGNVRVTLPSPFRQVSSPGDLYFTAVAGVWADLYRASRGHDTDGYIFAVIRLDGEALETFVYAYGTAPVNQDIALDKDTRATAYGALWQAVGEHVTSRYGYHLVGPEGFVAAAQRDKGGKLVGPQRLSAVALGSFTDA